MHLRQRTSKMVVDKFMVVVCFLKTLCLVDMKAHANSIPKNKDINVDLM